MSYAIWLVPVGLVMGLVGLAAFLWSMQSGQLEDLDGAAERVLLAEAADRPLAADGIKPHRPPPVAAAPEGAGGSTQTEGKAGAHHDPHRRQAL